MRLFEHIRSRSKAKSNDDPHTHPLYRPNSISSTTSAPPNPTVHFPIHLVERILTFVCPHSQDGTYTPCEESMVDGGCMLCDLRDLAHCASVNRQWSQAAQTLLYRHVRIDAVHYCDREGDLAAVRRKRKSFNGRTGDLRDPPQERLQLFARTVRDSNGLAIQVRSLKMPYMTRETCKADLARTVSVLPNLRYVDLPDGFHNDDPSINTLIHELQSRCHDIRKMKYTNGAEGSFVMLGQESQWPNLEILELDRLSMDTSTLTDVLLSMTALRELKLIGLPSLDDGPFLSASAALPPLVKLGIKDAINVSVDGVVGYLSRPDVANSLTSLALSNTTILPSNLHLLLASAPNLITLYVSESVSRPFPISPIPPLASRSLQTLNYEISNAGPSPSSLSSPSESYYAYLARCILSGSLPALTNLYALSTSLPTLLLPPPAPFHAATLADQQPPGLENPLCLYTKSVSELEWDFTLITPPSGRNRRGNMTATRPMSLYNAPQLSPQWRDKGRESVMVGNGFGGYLMVPGEDKRPRSPRVKAPKKERDAWMG